MSILAMAATALLFEHFISCIVLALTIGLTSDEDDLYIDMGEYEEEKPRYWLLAGVTATVAFWEPLALFALLGTLIEVLLIRYRFYRTCIVLDAINGFVFWPIKEVI